jgi:diguanylate cyclase (GGDEF)-like protein/PAS domain S-box-containing protein
MNDRHFADLSLEFNRHIVNLLDSLSALSELAQLSINDMDEASLLKQALAALMANQDMERCSIFLLDVEHDVLTCAAGLDWEEMLRGVTPTNADPTPPRPGRQYRLDEGIIGQTAAAATLQHCRSCADDPRFMQHANNVPVQGSLLCVPIVCELRVLGVLNVFHPAPEFFTMWHERLVMLFCQSLGRLLTNHRLTHRLNAEVDRKSGEIARQQSFLQAVLDSAPEPMMVIGRDYRIMMSNRAARAAATTMSAASHCYQISHRRDTPCDGTDHPCPLQRVLQEEQTVAVVHEHFDAMGTVRLVELLAAPLRDGSGAIVGIIESARDITESRRIETALQRTGHRLREAQRMARIGSWERDFATDRVSCSDEMLNILGADATAEAWSFSDLLAHIHPEDRTALIEGYEKSIRQHLSFETTHRILQPGGIVSYVRLHCETLYNSAGAPFSTLGTVQDVTMSVLTEMSLRESEERFRTIADYTYGWEYWEGPQGEILYTSPSCQEVTGYSVSDFVMRPDLIYQIIHPEDRLLMAGHQADINHEDVGTLSFRIVRRDGGIRWIAHGCRKVYARDGRFMGRRASNRDITELKQAEEQIRQLAYYDSLTNLPNRRLLLDRLKNNLAHAKRHHRAMAIMFLDLDRFKQINDTLGHDAGDALLTQVAKRLTGCVRMIDTVARSGGDEFVIVLTEIAQPADAAQVAEKIIAACAPPIEVAGHTLNITTSIGIALYPVDGTDDVDMLMKKADMAMYAAKDAGRNGYRFFQPMP